MHLLQKPMLAWDIVPVKAHSAISPEGFRGLAIVLCQATPAGKLPVQI